MLKLANSKGQAVIECNRFMMEGILDRIEQIREQWEDLDKDQILKECIREEINYQLEYLLTASEVKDFKKTYYVYQDFR